MCVFLPCAVPPKITQVTRAFSFNKTPMKLIKRPVMSPQFGSTNSLTPASQLAKMKLASCTNINVNMVAVVIDTMPMLSTTVVDVTDEIA